MRNRRRPFYGWYIVGVAFMSLAMGAGTGGFTFSIFLPAMNEDLGWSRSAIVAAASINSVTAALAGPWLGRLVDLRGPRLVLVASVLAMGLSTIALGWVDAPWQFYVAYGLVAGAARSVLQSVAPGVMIANWFVRRRAAAYGVASMGPPLSNFLLPPAVTAMVHSHGWRAGWMGLGLFDLIIGLAPSLLLVRRRPQDMGLLPDGDEAPSTAPGARASAPPASEPDWTAREAVRSAAFWMVAGGMALILLAPNTSIVFMFSYMSSKGLDAAGAAAAISAVSGMQVLSRMFFWAPVVGRLGSVRWPLVLWASLLLCSSLLLAFAEGAFWAYVAAVVLGVGMGGNLVLQLQVWPEYFGRTSIGAIIGTGQLLQGLTAAIVPFLLAGLLDQTGSYALLYSIVSGFVAIGLLLHLKVGVPRRGGRTEAL